MKQYHKHLQVVLNSGDAKPPARANMPSSLSYFGYQNRYDLREGFPILTTKAINFKHIVTELLWFLKGDSHVKYLIDNGCNIWNEDAYNFYLKSMINYDSKLEFRDFVKLIKQTSIESLKEMSPDHYVIGDTGEQYPKLWRKWKTGFAPIDQISNLIEGLKKSPQSRRHIITTWNPSTLDQMALHPCHTLVQFNCVAISDTKRIDLIPEIIGYSGNDYIKNHSRKEAIEYANSLKIPKYYLDCSMYQRMQNCA